MMIIGAIFPILFMLFLVGMVIVLQVYLSKTDSKVPGLILPVISFLLSLMITVGIASYCTLTPSYEETTSIEVVEVNEYDDSEEAYELSEDETGMTLLEEDDGGMEPDDIKTSSMILTTLNIFLLSNFPTMILVVVYILTRKRMNKEKHVNRTRIQDL